MRRILFLFLPLCCMIYACQKPDDSVDISPVPVFTAEGTLDGMPVSMAAGENGMYMYTFAREESDGTFAYGGRLAKENCETDCGPALEIFLIDTLPFVEQYGESRVWDSLQAMLFQGSVLNDTVRCAMGLTNHSYSAYGGLIERWQFNDGCIIQGKLNTDYLYFPSVGTVKTTLMMEDIDGNWASVQKTMDYYHEHDTGLNLKADPCTPGKVILKVNNPHQIGALSYKWSNGYTDSTICVDVNYGHTPYSVTISEGTINETILSCSVKRSGNGVAYLNANYSFDLEGHQFDISEAWPRVVIRYRDDNGKWYDSRNIHQDDYCNYFALTNIKPYQTNYQGIKTKKAEAFFTVSLRDTALQCIELEHFKVTFGFGSRE
ncbi:MAG: hypothetical protein IPI60_16590 [Saprospiraceae bacterium]|nr:hypothetical protein [Saprospiraceae bacterium]